MDATNQAEQPLRSVRRGRPPKVAAESPIESTSSAGQEYALRIWNGQSPDLPISERVARINAALLAQGYPDNFTAP